MNIAPKAVYIAEALAELAKPRVIEAHEYLAKWASLQSAGVPPVTIRHTIEAHTQSTPALGMVEGWAHAGERGLLALAGEVGCGKSHAAARWLLWRSRRGRWSRWLSCASWGRLSWDEIRPMLSELVNAPALVIDDLGAGMARGKGFTDAISGVLLERIGSRPTILCANGGADELQTWLDPRIVDRLKMGGAIPELRPISSLREDDDETLDAAGRGKVWRLSRALVDSFGCIEASVYDHETEAYSATELRVGGELVSATGRYGERAFRPAFELTGLAPAAVMARAREIEDADETTELEKKYREALDRLVASKANQWREDTERRAKKTADLIEAMIQRRRGLPGEGVRTDPVSFAGIAKWAEGRDGESKLRDLGFRTIERAGEWRLERVSGAGKDRRTQVLAMNQASKAAAWQRARELVST